jgi:hypothetical protein
MAAVASRSGADCSAANVGSLRSHQAMLLQGLSASMDNTPGVFAEATRNRDNYQKQLVQKLEETVRLITLQKAHLLQKGKHVKETANSCTSKFEHEMKYAKNRLSDELAVVADEIERGIDGLDQRMGQAEVALQEQRERRMAHIEATLGPIRDEAARISAALLGERKARKLQEKEREKLLADEIEAVTSIIDKEKVAQEHQLRDIAKWADAQEQRVAKHQYQLDKGIREHVASIRAEHQVATMGRIEKQHAITESIAAFIKRYREKMGVRA